MAEFSWAYIDGSGAGGANASGPTGSIQYRVADAGGKATLSGTTNFMFHTASNLMAVTGNVEISGTLTANQYNINVIDKTVTNLSASGDTIFGDTSDDTHQFTGSLLVNGNSTFGGNIITNGNANLNGNTTLGNAASDVVTVTGMLTASQGAVFSNQVMVVDDKNLIFGTNGDGIIKYDEAGTNMLVVSGSHGGLNVLGGQVILNSPVVKVEGEMQLTGSFNVTGTVGNKSTFINTTHVSSSLNISGSSIYAENDVHADQFYGGFNGDIVVSRYVTHNGDSDTFLDFTDDKLMVKVGNREFLTITESSTDTFVINRLEGPVNTTINSDNGDVLNASTAGVIINDSGMPGHDFRVESNQKQNAIYLDADLQYVHLLADSDAPAGGLGTDMSLFVSGTVGSKGTAIRGTTVFGGDIVASGSLSVTGSVANKGTILDSTHVSSSLNISGSAFYGDGSTLTGVVTEAHGSTGQIQFNNSDAFGASTALTVAVTPSGQAAMIVTGSSTTVGSVEAVSGSTQVFGIDSSASGFGGVRGRMVQHIRTGFSLSDGTDAKNGRYVSIGGNAVAVSATPSNVNCMISPFSGRLISIMYHMPSPGSKQDASKGQPQWEFRVGDVNALKGNTFGSALQVTGQMTASSWPGNNVVGGLNVQNKVGSLGGTNVTGTFSFGTGSVVALFFKSGDSTNNNYPGAASFTSVWEFDQLDPYITGSGN